LLILSAGGIADALAAQKPILPDQLKLCEAEAKLASAKCPSRAAPGMIVQAETCLLTEERKIWIQCSPETLDLFDTYASQILADAHQLDNGAYKTSDYAAAVARTHAQLSASLKQRVVAEFQDNLRSAAASCPSRAVPGQMAQTEGCKLDHQRSIWMKYAPKTVDLFDAYSAQQRELDRRFDTREYSAPNYEAASKELLAAFVQSLKNRTAEATQSASASTRSSDLFATEQIAPSDACAIVSSFIGLAVGIGTRRTDTGLNATNSFLKGCLEGTQK
jgi:hypothetical protein